MTPEEILTDKKEHTVDELIQAIKALGDTPKAIKEKLIELGFKEHNQKNAYKCPVCKYLESLGFESPYVDVSECRINVGQENQVKVDFAPNNLIAMKDFQDYASVGHIKDFGGYESPYEEEDVEIL